MAPLTGVPFVPAAPADCSTNGKVSGWLLLSVWLRLIQNDQGPLLLPMEALLFQLL